jgi:hypothetical protein
MAARENLPRAIDPMEAGMEALEHLSIMVALLLAMAAALVSSDTEARQEIIGFFAEVFKPQTPDLGADPGYLLGMATETVPPSLPKLDPIVRGVDRPLLRAE